MNPTHWTRRAAIHAMAFAVTAVSAVSTGTAQTVAPDGDFVYETQVGDTLIGLGQRLLLSPQRWPEVQARNSIANPRRIPVATRIHIPYAWLKVTPVTAQVTRVAGNVTSGGRNVREGESLAQGSRIETGEDGSVTLNLADGSVITLQKSGRLRLEEMERINTREPAHGQRLQLESGRLDTTVKPNRGVGRFEIVTPVAVSAVRGTRFRAAYSGDDDRALTETLEGAVAVAGRTDVLVPAGFGTRIERDGSPVAPVPLLPAPDLSGIPPTNSSTSLRVEFRPVSSASAYHVQLSGDPDFLTIAVDEVSSATTVSVDALPDGNYWLRVRAIDALGIEGADAMATLVQHVLLEAPRAGTPQPAERVVAKQVAFAWSPVATASRYQIQIARDEAFAELALDRDSAGETGLTVDTLPAGRYYWRVAAFNSAGERGLWTEALTFTRLPDPPLPDIPTIEGHQLQIRWAAVEGEKYRLQVARDPDFRHLVTTQDLDEPLLSMKKPAPGTYYARVQLVDADGTTGPFGASRRFEIPVPLWLQILLPLVAFIPLLG